VKSEFEGTTPAPDGWEWICRACGKRSRTRYGFTANDQRCAEPGWDEACMLNSELVNIETGAGWPVGAVD